MKRFFATLAFAGALSLGACAIPTASIATDAQALLTAAEGNGSISTSTGLIVTDVINGYEAVSSEQNASISAGDSTTLAGLKSLNTAIGQLAADSTNATVVSDAKEAQTLLGDIINSSSGTVTQAQVETAVATFLIDYLAANSPASAAPGAAPSRTQSLINDARARIAAIH